MGPKSYVKFYRTNRMWFWIPIHEFGKDRPAAKEGLALVGAYFCSTAKVSRAYFNWTALSHDFQSCRKCRQIVIRSAFLATIIRSLYRDAVGASIMECASQQRRGHTWSGACPNGAEQIMGRKITMVPQTEPTADGHFHLFDLRCFLLREHKKIKSVHKLFPFLL